MCLHSQKNERRLKPGLIIQTFGAAGLLLLLSILMVACGSQQGQSQLSSNNDPAPTVTFQPNRGDGTPTPGIPSYLCGAWAVDTSPNIDAGKPVSIYAKFVHTVDGNPVGVPGATGTATVSWPDGATNVFTSQTTADGLAMFAVPLEPSSLNGIVLVNVAFTAPGVPNCSTQNRPAYFTAVHGAPAATPTPPDGGNNPGQGIPTMVPPPGPFPFPSPIGTLPPGVTPTRPPFPFPSPTVKP